MLDLIPGHPKPSKLPCSWENHSRSGRATKEPQMHFCLQIHKIHTSLSLTKYTKLVHFSLYYLISQYSCHVRIGGLYIWFLITEMWRIGLYQGAISKGKWTGLIPDRRLTRVANRAPIQAWITQVSV